LTYKCVGDIIKMALPEVSCEDMYRIHLFQINVQFGFFEETAMNLKVSLKENFVVTSCQLLKNCYDSDN
jgi:hypothetical protein